MSVIIKEVDKGWKDLMRMGREDSFTLDVGVFDEEEAAVGLYNEYGTSKMPANPWMTDTFDKHSDYLRELEQLYRDIIDKKITLQVGLDRLGKKIVIDLKERVPVDTGALQRSITAKIERK